MTMHKVGKVVPGYPRLPMLSAVMNSETEEVRRRAERHQGLDEHEPDDQTTLMIYAAPTGQWPIVEILIDHGADI